MRIKRVFLLILLLAAVAGSFLLFWKWKKLPEIFVQNDFVPYTVSTTIGGGQKISVDILSPNITQERAKWLALMADRSTCTTDPIRQDPNGMMEPPDRVIITEKLLIWFGFSAPLGGISSGGGFVRGVWTLKKDSAGNLNFSSIKNANNWAPNELLPGADGNCNPGGGVSFLMALGSANVDDPVAVTSLMAENSGLRDFLLTARPIRDGGWGDGIGYFYQARSKLVHNVIDLSTLRNSGYDSIYDLSSTPGQETQVEYLINYRIPMNKPILHQEIAFTPRGGDTDKIATFVLSHNNHGGHGFQYRYFTTDVGTIKGWGCTSPPHYAAHKLVDIRSTTGNLIWWQSATQGKPGTYWTLFENSNRTGRFVKIEPLLYPPFTTPDRIQVIRNSYSMPGTWVCDYDMQFTDINQCGGNVVWRKDTPVHIGNRLYFNDLSYAPPLLVCTPNTKECAGNILKTCKADGSGWTQINCASQDKYCGPFHKQCLDYACSTGEKQCSGNYLLTCKSDRKGWDKTTCQYGCSNKRCNLLGDFNNDGQVNFSDIKILILGYKGSDLKLDLNKDNLINALDFVKLINILK